jgi:Protein of unknown function (DUF3309)
VAPSADSYTHRRGVVERARECAESLAAEGRPLGAVTARRRLAARNRAALAPHRPTDGRSSYALSKHRPTQVVRPAGQAASTAEVAGRWNNGGSETTQTGEKGMITILIVVLILMLIGALPTWPHSRSWGYYPSSGLGLVALVLVVLLLMGRL